MVRFERIRTGSALTRLVNSLTSRDAKSERGAAARGGVFKTRADGARNPATTVADLALSWLDLETRARLFVDETLRLLWANRDGCRLLEEGRDLELRDGVLSARTRANQPDLHRFILQTGREVATLCLPSDGGHLLLRAREIGTEGERRFFGLSFHHSAKGFTARYADLDRAFRFTQAEHRVVLKMIEGLTADEIAAEAGQSIETVRTHIRNIYVKAEACSREGLFARLRPYRV